jgi:hypothetical protein
LQKQDPSIEVREAQTPELILARQHLRMRNIYKIFTWLEQQQKTPPGPVL